MATIEGPGSLAVRTVLLEGTVLVTCRDVSAHITRECAGTGVTQDRSGLLGSLPADAAPVSTARACVQNGPVVIEVTGNQAACPLLSRVSAAGSLQPVFTVCPAAYRYRTRSGVSFGMSAYILVQGGE